MGKTLSKSSHSDGMIRTVFSVCGHSEKRRASQDGDPRCCVLDIKKRWLPKNTECRAGWCPMCVEHYKRRRVDVLNEDVINRYWSYLAKRRWAQPVHPGRVSSNALKAGVLTASSRQAPAHILVAACLYSLRLDSHQSSKALTAAKIIHNGTTAWVSRANAEARSRAQRDQTTYLSAKTLPQTSIRYERTSNHRSRDIQVSAPQHAGHEIGETLQGSRQVRESSVTARASRNTQAHTGRTGHNAIGMAGTGRYPRDEDDQHIDLSITSSPRLYCYRALSPPPRPLLRMARCQLHGRINSSSVDMTCELCAWISLDESTVPIGSPLGNRDCDWEFYESSTRPDILAAMHGICNCDERAAGTCDACSARREFALRTGVDWM